MSTGTGAVRVLDWAQMDVFAERALEGNMLAIFTDARGLSAAEMQSLARETNLSETTFILPSSPEEERERGVRVRIFTVHEELPFAGHPTLGTACWIYLNHPTLQGSEEVRLRLDAGTIPVRFRLPDGSAPGVFGEMQQRDPEFGATMEREVVAAVCGLLPGDLHESLRPQVVSTGLPFCVVPLASVDALARMRIDEAKRAEMLASAGARFLYAIAKVDSNTWRARMPFYGSDDPATGSAAGCAVSYLVRHAAVGPSETVVFLQGIEAGRPSRLVTRASLHNGGVTGVFVGGRTIAVAEGRFILR